MTATDSFFAHWYFHLPNLIMAAAIYTLIGRYLLSLMFRRNPDRVILRVFATVTDPILDAVGAITPRIVPRGLLIVFAVVWLMALRMVWFVTLALLGVRFSVGEP